MPPSSVLTLFKRCLGFNDARAFGTFKMITDANDPNAGNVEFIDCLNLTTTPDGCVEKIAPLVTAVTHSAPITGISAGKRFVYQDGTDVKEWDGTNTYLIGSVKYGPTVHTPIDVRLTHASTVYKSPSVGTTLSAATLGDTSDIPATSKPFYGMPSFQQAFVFNGLLYCVNASDPRFLQYSEQYHYDVYALGDNHIGHLLPIRQGGAVPGALIVTHDTGVTVYAGMGPHDFVKKFYTCGVLNNTLWSGFVSKVYGNAHVWMCDDGIYMTDQNGAIVNLTVDQTDYLDRLNNVYYGAIVNQNGKYLAFGDLCCVEYDFKTKTILKRSPFGITSACVWNNVPYFASGALITTYGTSIDTSNNFGCSLTLPYSDWSNPGKKSIESLYFTGTINGDWIITATDEFGEYWELDRSDELLNVSNYRIKTPKRILGNHISLKIECTSGSFRMEKLAATLSVSNRRL